MSPLTKPAPLETVGQVDAKLRELRSYIRYWHEGRPAPHSPVICLQLIDELLLLRFTLTSREPAPHA